MSDIGSPASQYRSIWLESADEFSSLCIAEDLKFISTGGYYTLGDGGGGNYYVDLEDTTTPEDCGSVWIVNGKRVKLLHDNQMSLKQWGITSNVKDSTDLFQKAICWAENISSLGEGVRGVLTYPAGQPIRISKTLNLNIPICLDVKSFIHYNNSTGPALIFGSDPASTTRDDWEIRIEGLRALLGNTTTPNGFNPQGCTGVEFRNSMFGDFKIKNIIAFSYTGIYFNSTNNSYINQHSQDNEINIGKIGYCGIGLLIKSTSAEYGATQVNKFKIKNFITNYKHLILGNPSVFDNNSNDNLFEILAMEGCTSPDKIGAEIYGLYNNIHVIYASTTDCYFAFAGPSDGNKLVVDNPGVTVKDYTENGKSNMWRVGHPNPNILPAHPVPSFSQNYSNEYGIPVEYSFSYQLTPTANSDSSITAYTGKNAGSLSPRAVISTTAQSSPHSVTSNISFVLQPGHVWQLVKSGAGTANLASSSVASVGF